jgi:2-polyprenyl-6-methoxyphenol hydroxylase-like FAD-dependent oxidoreductase
VTRILVIGGGIAGTATAMALHRAGIEAAVYEAHPDSADDIGAFLTLAGNGMRALAQLDASAAVTSVGFPLTSMRVVDHAGAELAHVPLGEAGDPRLRYRCLRRGELNAALQAEAARRGIDIVHGARLVSVEDSPDTVTAHFADGSTATGDLLVGADGLNSTVRRAIAPATQPSYAGQRVFYGYTGAASASGPDACITMVRGRTVSFGCAVSPGGEAHWFARVPGEALSADELARGPVGGWRELLVPLLREDAPAAVDVVAAATGDILVTNATDIPTGSLWRTSRILLVGDAAHAASPATGQGASMALEDAVVLAKSLRDAPDTETALSLYEAVRRPRAEHNTTVSGNISRGTRTPSGPVRGPAPSRPGDEDLVRLLDWDEDLMTMRPIQQA